MRQKVYIETTIVSYLTARPARTIVAAARQQITTDWWEQRRHIFDLFSSEVVVREASRGDTEAARRRLNVLRILPLLAVDQRVTEIAAILVEHGLIPAVAADDALHIVLCVVHGMDYLLTWNCAHIANAQIQAPMAKVVAQVGYVLPTICTPDELFGEIDEQ
jgi:predicted nucleic acid-binding protein